MNKTNFLHAGYALLMLVPFGLLGQWIAGVSFVMAWFISREHAHRQNDIADVTGVSVGNQNPIDGFKGWSLDAKLDVIFPAVVCVVVLGVVYGAN